MKRAILPVAIVALSWGILRADDVDPPRIVVYGTATTKVTPDLMEWRLTVRNKGDELEDVAVRHTEIVEEVLSLLRRKAVDEDQLQTARMELGENRVYRDNSWIMEGYFASTNISFRIDDFQKYSDIWFGLAKMSDVSIDGVYYDHSKRIDHQDETRQKALLVARKKAEAMAATLSTRIGEPLLIEDDMSYQDRFGVNRFSNAAFLSPSSGDEAAQQGGISPGQIPIKMRVKVAFRLLSQPE